MDKRTSPISSEVEQEIKLQLNERLFQGGHITAEMYERAKTMILKATYLVAAKEAS